MFPLLSLNCFITHFLTLQENIANALHLLGLRIGPFAIAQSLPVYTVGPVFAPHTRRFPIPCPDARIRRERLRFPRNPMTHATPRCAAPTTQKLRSNDLPQMTQLRCDAHPIRSGRPVRTTSSECYRRLAQSFSRRPAARPFFCMTINFDQLSWSLMQK